MGVAHAGLTNLLFEDGHRDAHHPPQEEKNHRKVAVCFFGLTRSLRWTLPSIEKRLLGVLRDSGMKVEVFLHTYDLLEVGDVVQRVSQRENACLGGMFVVVCVFVCACLLVWRSEWGVSIMFHTAAAAVPIAIQHIYSRNS